MSADISVKINNYIQSKGLSGSPTEQVLSDMVSEGVLTQAEYNYAIENHIFGTISQQTTVGDTVIVSDSTQQTPQPTQTRKAHHPVFKELELDSSGKIDTNQFNLETIKQKFPPPEYNIITDPNNENAVTVSRNGRNIYGYMNTTDLTGKKINMLVVFNSEEKSSNSFEITDGILSSYTERQENDSFIITKIMNGNLSDIESKTICYPDRSRTTIQYEDLNNFTETKYDSENNIKQIATYKNGKLYEVFDGETNTTRNIPAENIFTVIQNNYNNWNNTIIPQIAENELVEQLSALTQNNISDISAAYKKNYSLSLISDILVNANSMNDESKKRVLDYLDSIGLINQPDENIKNNYIAQRIEGFSNSDAGAHNIENIITSLDTSTILPITDSFGQFDSDKTQKNKYSPHTLLEIINSSNLSEESKNNCSNHIINTLIEYSKEHGQFCDDIINDLNNSKNNFNNYNIHFRRLVSRLHTTPNSTTNSKINGKLDQPHNQRSTGDCWLVIGMNTIKHKKGGQKILDDLLEPDDKNNNLIVNLPYAPIPTIAVPFETIMNSTHLLDGDPDGRGFEIATDNNIKYLVLNEMIEIAKNKIYLNSDNNETIYSPIPSDTDLQGGFTSTFYQWVLGNSNIESDVDMQSKDFNNEDQVFTFGYHNTEEKIKATVTNKENMEITLDTNHAYGVLSSDDKFIYLEDPRWSDWEIRVPRENFKNYPNDLCSAYLDKNKAPKEFTGE